MPWGFPHSLFGKESACNAGDLGLIPGLGWSPGEGKGYPLQYSGLVNSMDCIVCGVAIIDYNWRLIALQYFGGFCHTWISYRCTCLPHPEPTALPIPSLWVVPVHQLWMPCFMHWTWTGDLFHICNIHVSMLFSQIIPHSPCPTESKSLFFLSVSLTLLHILSCIVTISLNSIYMC